VTDLRQAQRAKVAAAALLIRHGFGKPHGPVPAVVVHQGQYSFSQLEYWRDIIYDGLFTRDPDLTILDLDEAANRVRIEAAVSNPNAFVGITRRLADLGVDTAAVLMTWTSPPRQLSARSPYAAVSVPADIRDYADSLAGGLAVGLYNDTTYATWCTLGIAGSWSGEPVVVTASHCSATKWGLDGRNLYQEINKAPLGSARHVANEAYDPAGYTCGFNTCRASDASVWATDVGIPLRVGAILNAAGNGGYLDGGYGGFAPDVTTPYLTVGQVENGDLIVGQIVHKLGAKTGHTWGDLTNTCEDHQDGTWGGAKITRCVYRAGLVTDGGDSGGPVWVDYNGTWVKFAGILLGEIGDRMVFSKWSRVVSDLGSINILGGTAPTPTFIAVTITGTTTIGPGASCSWGAGVSNADGTVHYVWYVDGVQVGDDSAVLYYTNSGSDFTISVTVTADNGPAYATKSVVVDQSSLCE
jgi:hypothetical protein